MQPENLKQAGYQISERGRPIAAGVVCKCPASFCPAHGERRDKQKIAIERSGTRVYLTGDTYLVKDQIKAIGGHWDGDRKAWWVGAAKAEAAQSLVSGLASAPASQPDAKQDPRDIRLTGKGRYKGREYFAGSMTRDGLKVRLLTLPDAAGNYLDFWALRSEVEQTKSYHPREYRGRMEYTTLGSIASFVTREKRNRDAGGDVCAECGKSGELVRDLEDGQMKHRHCCDIES